MKETQKPTGRFDYVRYDEDAQQKQLQFKTQFELLARTVDLGLYTARMRFLTMLEQAMRKLGEDEE